MEWLFFFLRLRNTLCFCMNIRSSVKKAFLIIFSISVAMTAGILIVYYTFYKPPPTCDFSFKRMMKSSIVFSSQPRAVAIGDLNNDQQMDIVVAHSGNNTIGIFLSDTNGTFAKQYTYSTGFGSRPSSIALAHFNADNFLDIVVANYATNNLGIFLGNGDGTFGDQKQVSTGSSHPIFVTVAHLNSDHQIDLVVVNYGTDSVGIFLGYGNGSFQQQTSYSTGYDSNPYTVAVGDFNNDNHSDIAVANSGTNNVGILLGYGNGTFASQKIYTTRHNSKPLSVVVADFNNDQHLDVAVGNNKSGNVGIFFGHGNGSFQSQAIYPIESVSHPEYMTVGDLNNDNQVDLVITDSINDRVYIIRGHGNGSFDRLTTYDTIPGSSPVSVVVCDFNRNNQTDLVIGNFGTNNVMLLMDYYIQPSARQVNYDIGSYGVVAVAVSDLNNDGIPDIVSASNYVIVIISGLNDGTFDGRSISRITTPVSVVQYVCVGDMNNDSRVDIITANSYNNSIGVMLGRGNGTFDSMIIYSTGDNSFPMWVALGDMNNDGRLDIVCASRYSDNIGIFFGQGDGIFAPIITYSTRKYSSPMSVAVGDMDNDGHLDIIVSCYSGYVFVFLGRDNSTFVLVTELFTSSVVYSVAVVDLNKDNYLDIVTANTLGSGVSVSLGHGNGTFAPQTKYSCRSNCQPYNAGVADFNNDNISDIAVSVFNNDEVIIFYGYGNGSFTLERTFSTGLGSNPYRTAVANFDLNKQLRIVVTLWSTGDVAVLTEYLAAKFVHEVFHLTGSTSLPVSVAIGDFNHDNRSDVVVANFGTGSLGVLLGMGNGTFGMETLYSIDIDSGPQYVITCDINKDQQLDIVSVNSKLNSISTLIGRSDGTFETPMMYPTGKDSHPSTVTSGDLNSDGWLDLIVVNEGTDSVGVFFGFNYSTFQKPVVYSSDDSLGPAGIIVDDFNNDSFADLAVTFNFNSAIGIYLGCGNGSFILTSSYRIVEHGTQPVALAAGDFNNDSRLDIVVSGIGTNYVYLLLGQNNGSFVKGKIYSSEGSIPISVAVGDLNNDHRSDIVVANRDSNNIVIFFGYGNGSFSKPEIYSLGQASQPYCIILRDLNGDNHLDILVANSGTDSVGILFGYGNGTFADQVILSTLVSSRPYWVDVGDFNNDTLLDIAVANLNRNEVGILLQNRNGTFASITTYSTGSGSIPRSLSIGDFNNDNISDIVVVIQKSKSIVVLFGVGDGSFLLGTTYTTGIGSIPAMLAIGDFNNDNRLDIAVTDYLGNNTLVFLGNGNEFLAGVETYTTDSRLQPRSVAVGDFNNDQQMDIVIANYKTDNVGIFLGPISRRSLHMEAYALETGSAPYCVAVADVNNDTYLDIVVTNSGIDKISILFGYGNGMFKIGANYSTGVGSRPYTVVISDFNNDHVPDIAVANSGTSNIFSLIGHGDGTFGNETTYPLGYGYHPYSIAATDLSGEGLMDIVIACFSTDHIETLVRTC